MVPKAGLSCKIQLKDEQRKVFLDQERAVSGNLDPEKKVSK